MYVLQNPQNVEPTVLSQAGKGSPGRQALSELYVFELGLQSSRVEAWPCISLPDAKVCSDKFLTLQGRGNSHSPIICFCSCSGAAASMDAVRGSCPGTCTAGSWTCTWHEDTSLNHTGGQSYPQRVSTGLQGSLWRRGSRGQDTDNRGQGAGTVD